MTNPVGRRPAIAVLGGAVVLLGVFLVCLSLGPDSRISLFDQEMWKGYLAGSPDQSGKVVFRIRLPRVLAACLVGGSLSLAGLVFQNLLQNPLADPFLIGVSGGAALGATLVQAAGLHDLPALIMAAFLGGIVSMAFVSRLARVSGTMDRGTLILAGVVLNSFLSAVISILLILSGQDMPRIFAWLMGSLNLPESRALVPMGFLAAVSAGVLWISSHPLDILGLGDFQAYHLGMDPEKFKWISLICASILTAVAVSLSGMVGFIGMFVPHGVRFMFGYGHRILVPMAFLGGAMVLALADTIVRVSPFGVELPVGGLTALMGGPVFLFLLIRRKGVFRSPSHG